VVADGAALGRLGLPINLDLEHQIVHQSLAVFSIPSSVVSQDMGTTIRPIERQVGARRHGPLLNNHLVGQLPIQLHRRRHPHPKDGRIAVEEIKTHQEPGQRTWTDACQLCCEAKHVVEPYLLYSCFSSYGLCNIYLPVLSMVS